MDYVVFIFVVLSAIGAVLLGMQLAGLDPFGKLERGSKKMEEKSEQFGKNMDNRSEKMDEWAQRKKAERIAKRQAKRQKK